MNQLFQCLSLFECICTYKNIFKLAERTKYPTVQYSKRQKTTNEGNVMSVRARNPINFSLATTDSFSNIYGRLSACGPNAVRNAYKFFGLNCAVTYKEFCQAGFHSDGATGVQATKSKEFLTHESLGLDIKVLKARDKADFIEKIKSARERNHPIIMVSPEHYYLILPYKITKKSDNGYDLTVRPGLSGHGDWSAYIGNNFFKNSKEEACICVGALFHLEIDGGPYENDAFNTNLNGDNVSMVTPDLVWEKLKETKVREFYEVRKIKLNACKPKAHKYEWGKTEKEYKRYHSMREKRARHFYGAFVEIMKSAIKANDFEAAQICFRNLQTVFSMHPVIGLTLKKEFDKNLPMIINERRVS
jgi:hypothetical protein